MLKIGYFVPEFPGQTHSFFWREIRELRLRNIDPVIISTAKPKKRIISHLWAEEAIHETTYLYPPSFIELISAIMTMLMCGPAAWIRCFRVFLKKNDVKGVVGNLRFCLLIIMGGQLVRIAKKHGITHIHVHSCADAANIALFAKLLGNINYSLTLHGPLADYGANQHAKWVNALFSIVITQKLYREIQDEFADSLPYDVMIAPMGVDLHAFSREKAYVPWNRTGSFRIFSCGRLNPCKGHEYLIRAVIMLRQSGLNACLDIAGAEDSENSQYLNELKLLIEEYDLFQYVRLLGAVSEFDVKCHLENAHVFGLASLHEPLGVVIMEAMSMELPVVVTNGGGVMELVEDGQQGLLVTASDVEGMCQAFLRISCDPQQAKDMGARGRKRVEESFHSGISAQAIMKGLHYFSTNNLLP